jgi:predicted metal-dependent phosphotriesterase family hydrolase
MTEQMKTLRGKVITVLGPVAPIALGKVLMHEHVCSDLYDWENHRLVVQEKPNDKYMQYLMREAVPHLRKCGEYGCSGICDVTMPPWRAWPDVYQAVAREARTNIVLATGFYREIELGSYFVKTPEDQIWPYVRKAPVEELAEMCIREIVEGIHGSEVHAGCIKLGTSGPVMTETEAKTFRAGAIAQKATGVHITTHCTRIGAETAQLSFLDAEGVDLRRVVIGHAQGHLTDPNWRKVCLDWMRRGANFLSTNLGIKPQDPANRWQGLVDAIQQIFDAGHGDKLVLGLDSGYCSESGPLEPMRFLPPHPFLHMFTHTLPSLRQMGLTAEQEEAMMTVNPHRILPVQ